MIVALVDGLFLATVWVGWVWNVDGVLGPLERLSAVLVAVTIAGAVLAPGSSSGVLHEEGLAADQRLFRAAVGGTLGAFVVLDALNADPSAQSLVLAGALALVALTAGRMVLAHWLRRIRRRGRFVRNAVVIGTTPAAVGLFDHLGSDDGCGLQLVGLVSVDDRSPQSDFPSGGIRTIGALGDLEEIVTTHHVGLVAVAPDVLPDHAMRTLSDRLASLGVPFALGLGLSGVHPRLLRNVAMARRPFIVVERSACAGVRAASKRVLDILIASTAMLCAAPLLILAAVAVKLADGGPVLFRQTRVGRDGLPFTMLKLRTMTVEAEGIIVDLREQNERDGPLFKMENDPRVTPCGRVLRLSSIDELPQLVNVLRGDMSLVGPRPALPDEVRAFPPQLHERHRVRPGLTGLWQVEARDDPSFRAYEQLDLYYVDNWSLRMDLRILVATIGAVLRPVVRASRRRLGAAPRPTAHLPHCEPPLLSDWSSSAALANGQPARAPSEQPAP